tara:strand:- start:3420 stop:4502 length:1083 start_codon:yes stop_codon:yes gene_type:complete
MTDLLRNISRENIQAVLRSSNWANLINFNKKNLNFVSKSCLPSKLSKIEKLIYEYTCDNSWMGECAKYHLQTGGRRFRASLALISAEILGFDEKISNYVAASCELIHNASLIHDDLQDRDLLRRGKPTIWSRFGDASAINLGDHFISNAFQILSSAPTNSDMKCIAISELSKAIKQAVAGQTREIQTRANIELQMKDYESTAKAKTGSLLSLPVKLILILSGKLNKANSLKSIYESGLAYQIQDDLSDFIGIKERGLPGRDLKEGKMNILIMHYLNEASVSEKYLLNLFLKRRFESISEEEILLWITKIKEKNIIEKTLVHLNKVVRRSVLISKNTGPEFHNITKFVIKNILKRISKKIL